MNFWSILEHFCHHFWVVVVVPFIFCILVRYETFITRAQGPVVGGFAVALLLHPPKSDNKNGQEMFNWSEVHSEKKYYL